MPWSRCRAHAPPIHATLRCYSLAVQPRKNGHQARYARQRFTSFFFPFSFFLFFPISFSRFLSSPYLSFNLIYSQSFPPFLHPCVIHQRDLRMTRQTCDPIGLSHPGLNLSGQRRPRPSPPGKVRICTCLLSFFDLCPVQMLWGRKFPRGQILRNAERAMLRNALSYGKIILIFLVTLSLLSRTQKRVAIGIQVRTSIEIVQQLIFLFQKIYTFKQFMLNPGRLAVCIPASPTLHVFCP